MKKIIYLHYRFCYLTRLLINKIFAMLLTPTECKTSGYLDAGRAGETAADFQTQIKSFALSNVLPFMPSLVGNKNPTKRLTKLRKDELKLQNKKAGIDGKIKSVNEQQEKLKTRNNQIEDQIEKAKEINSEESKQKTVFSSVQFWLSAVILLFVTFYLFLFYVATVYKVFNTDLNQIIAEGKTVVNVFPSGSDLIKGFTTNPMYIFVPFIFFAFGYALHINETISNKLKISKRSALLLIVSLAFIVDALIAYQIHEQINIILDLYGENTRPVYQDTNFYTILFMGFAVYLIWGLLLEHLLHLLSLKDPEKGFVRKHLYYEKRIFDYEDIMEKYEEKRNICEEGLIVARNNIEQLNEISGEVLKGMLNEYKTGWENYINGLNKRNDLLTLINIKHEKFTNNSTLEKFCNDHGYTLVQQKKT